jgi:hypothetical protein
MTVLESEFSDRVALIRRRRQETIGLSRTNKCARGPLVNASPKKCAVPSQGLVPWVLLWICTFSTLVHSWLRALCLFQGRELLAVGCPISQQG